MGGENQHGGGTGFGVQRFRRPQLKALHNDKRWRYGEGGLEISKQKGVDTYVFDVFDQNDARIQFLNCPPPPPPGKT